jgi:hypothetical protein
MGCQRHHCLTSVWSRSVNDRIPQDALADPHSMDERLQGKQILSPSDTHLTNEREIRLLR